MDVKLSRVLSLPTFLLLVLVGVQVVDAVARRMGDTPTARALSDHGWWAVFALAAVGYALVQLAESRNARAWRAACERAGLQPVKTRFQTRFLSFRIPKRAPIYHGMHRGHQVFASQSPAKHAARVALRGHPRPDWRASPALANVRDAGFDDDAVWVEVPSRSLTAYELQRLFDALASVTR